MHLKNCEAAVLCEAPRVLFLRELCVRHILDLRVRNSIAVKQKAACGANPHAAQSVNRRTSDYEIGVGTQADLDSA